MRRGRESAAQIQHSHFRRGGERVGPSGPARFLCVELSRRVGSRALSSALSIMRRPSAPPSDSSNRRSGCGIRPTMRPRLVADAGDVALGAVGVGLRRRLAGLVAIAEDDAPFALEAVERRRIGEIVAFRVRDRQAHDLTLAVALGEERLVVVDAQGDVAADELERGVAHQDAGQQARLAQHLEAVADAEHRRAGLRLGDDVAHDRRVGGHGAAAQIVAVGKAARQHDEVGGGHGRIAVPDHLHREPGDALQRDLDVAVAVGAGEDDDGGAQHLGSVLVRRAAARRRNSRSRCWRADPCTCARSSPWRDPRSSR